MEKNHIGTFYALFLSNNQRIFRIMRLFLLFLVSSISLAFASEAHSQSTRVNINLNRTQAKEVIKAIEAQTDYLFVYNSSKIDLSRKVSVNATDKAVSEILNEVFANSDVTYTMRGNNILLLKKDVLEKETTQQENRTIQGKITDMNGEPLIGANVLEKGTTNGVITNVDGKFQMNVGKEAILVVSYIGYTQKEVPTKNITDFNIKLKEDSELLDEVVIVGFGTQKKANLTGAVASVSGEALESKPVANIGQALQGVIPNLNVSATSAQPNAVPSFNVRGGTSMAQNDKGTWEIKNGSPLILVDGVQMDETYLSMLNPNDVENISLLKDAASAAIYGARATYGVMLITTKSGKKEQKANVTYNFNMQWNTPSHRPDIMDAYNIQLAANQLTELTGGTVSSFAETLLEAKKAWKDDPQNAPAWIYNEGSTSKFTWVRSMNPYDEVVRDWTPMQKHTVSITGGTAKTKYYISLGYQRQEGMYKINTDTQNRFNGMMSLDTEINKWFSFSAKMSYNTNNYEEPYLNPQKESLWGAMMGEVNRNICSPIQSSATDPVPGMWTDNVLGWIAYGATRDTKRTNSVFNITPTITFMKGWTAKAELSYRPGEYFQKMVVPTREYIVDDWTSIVNTHTSPSRVEETTTHSDFYTINAYTNYDKTFGKHSVGGVLGFNQEWYVYRRTYGKAEGLLNPSLPMINTSTGNQYAGDNAEHWAIRGGFARLTYGFDSRYLLEFNGRYDGTSRFPKKDRFKFFPSLSAGWRISEEKFMEDSNSWLNNLKVRGSWGSLGNQNVDNYAYIAEYGSVGYVSYNMDKTRPMGISPSGLISPTLTWETATTLDFGLDANLFNNRLELSFDWYTRETKDILMAGAKYPAILGTSAPKMNSGILKTNGWELSMKWQDRIGKDWKYDVSFVLSDYITTVKTFSGNPNKLLNALYDGKVMGEIWGYQCEGILQESDFDIDENGKYILKGASQTDLNSTWYPGDLRFADIGGKEGTDDNKSDQGPDGRVSNGKNTVYNSGDLRVLGNSTPRFRFGLNGNVYWKNFSLNLFFQGVAKRDVYISDSMLFGGSDSAGNYDTFQNSWTPENTNSKYHMYGRGQNTSSTNSRYMYNGAFIRLKTLALGYTLPRQWTEKVSLNTVRVNLSGYNLFEISGVPSVYDPESIQSAYPMMRSIALGVQVNF